MTKFTQRIFELADNSDLAFVVVVLVLIGAGYLMGGCSTRTLRIAPDGTVNATHTAVGYCPEAVLIRIDNGTVEMLSEASGVGATVQALGHDAAEVMKP